MKISLIVLFLFSLVFFFTPSEKPANREISSYIPSKYPISSDENINIFLVMGLTREKRHWGKDVSKKIKKFFPNSNLIFMDLPGAGELNEINSPETVPEYVEIMREKYKANVSDSGKNIVIATSLSGLIISDWAYRYPEDFQKIVLVSTAYKGTCGLFERAKIGVLPKLIEIYLQKNIEKREKKILSINTNNFPEKKYLLDEYVEIQKSRPMSAENIKNQTFAGKNYVFEGDIQSDVLLLGSKKDRLVDFNCYYKMAKEYNFSLSLNESSGHGIPIDAQDWLFLEVQKWLDSNKR